MAKSQQRTRQRNKKGAVAGQLTAGNVASSNALHRSKPGSDSVGGIAAGHDSCKKAAAGSTMIVLVCAAAALLVSRGQRHEDDTATRGGGMHDQFGDRHVAVRKSSVKGAGLGAFALRSFSRGEAIASYRCVFSRKLTATDEVSTRILGRRTAPLPPFLISKRVPHGFTQDPGTDRTRSRSASTP